MARPAESPPFPATRRCTCGTPRSAPLKAMGWTGTGPSSHPPRLLKPVTSVTVDTGDLGNRANVALYSLSLALQPINPEAYLQRGRAWSRLQQHQRAIADCGAFLLLARPDRLARAEVLFRRAMLSRYLQDHPRCSPTCTRWFSSTSGTSLARPVGDGLQQRGLAAGPRVPPRSQSWRRPWPGGRPQNGGPAASPIATRWGGLLPPRPLGARR
jgi:hypothetical protein